MKRLVLALVLLTGCPPTNCSCSPPVPHTGASEAMFAAPDQVVTGNRVHSESWKRLGGVPLGWDAYRTEVPGGWLVVTYPGTSATQTLVIPDPEHRWLAVEPAVEKP